MSQKSVQPGEQRERIDTYLERHGYAGRHPRIVPLTGDASERRYYRVLDSGAYSFVLALYPSPFDVSSMPFVNVARLLEKMPVPIPRVIGHADDLGILALEDLGDLTLQAHLGVAAPAQHAALYRQAVALIATLQQRGDELASDEYLPYRIAFDVEKLTWEMDFFVKHFVEAYRGVLISPVVIEALAEEFGGIVNELASERRVLCHRDYHSRNLMWHQDRLYIIDFQDARMGPDTYDLASLLRDAYVDLSDQVTDDLISHFLALRGGTEPACRFRERFDLMSLQRNLKALGTFGYQTTERRNPVYIQYIPRTLRHVRDNLDRHPRFGRLREVLAALVEEFRNP
jgi:N-acetylmuramate 1-kinase